MTALRLTDFEGCLLAGAAGDALGYEIEFCQVEEIFRRFGPEGIAGLALHGGAAQISDDTQMTLYTAQGLLNGDLWGAYREWWHGQMGRAPEGAPSFLWQYPAIRARRAPGGTCLNAIAGNEPGTMEDAINNSKGCGGVMRAAPAGLIAATAEEAARLGAEVGYVTHSHPFGWLPAAVLADAVWRLVRVAPAKRTPERLRKTLLQAADDLPALFPDLVVWSEKLRALLQKAAGLAQEPSSSDRDALAELGEGWVGEEAIAIAYLCCLRHPKDLPACLRMAVNHSGDSDSTGAVAGNLLGAWLGRDALPAEWLAALELREPCEVLAKRLLEQASAVPG